MSSVTWKKFVPPTEAEIAAYCEEKQVVRPAPSDERAVNSFAGWLVEWVGERRPMWEPCDGP